MKARLHLLTCSNGVDTPRLLRARILCWSPYREALGSRLCLLQASAPEHVSILFPSRLSPPRLLSPVGLSFSLPVTSISSQPHAPCAAGYQPADLVACLRPDFRAQGYILLQCKLQRNAEPVFVCIYDEVLARACTRSLT